MAIITVRYENQGVSCVELAVHNNEGTLMLDFFYNSDQHTNDAYKDAEEIIKSAKLLNNN